MKTLDLNLGCPGCQREMRVAALACDACGCKVEGRFEGNEFARLSAEDLHFLRTFVHCEGRIREMEGPLGLSYPTIRSRLTAFKEKLSKLASTGPAVVPPEIKEEENEEHAAEVLARLKSGEITYKDALAKLKKGKKK